MGLQKIKNSPTDRNMSLTDLPKPVPGKQKAYKLFLFTILALACLGCVIYWVTRTSSQKGELQEQAGSFINDLTEGTPLSGLGNLIRHAPDPPPVYSRPTEPGTLAGQRINGIIESDSKNDNLQGNAEGEENLANSNLPASQLEDREVKPVYIKELAQWLARHYRPSSHSLDTSLQALNQFGGIAISSQIKGGRSALFRYAMQPSMVKGLYNLYINRFLEDLDEAGSKRGFSNDQNRQFHLALAEKTGSWASALEGVLGIQSLKEKLEHIENLAQKTVDSSMELTNAIFELDESREKKVSTSQMNVIQLRVNGLAARYRRATENHDSAQLALIKEIRKHAGQALDNGTLLFMASWVGRRLEADPDARPALQNCAQILRDLSKRCSQVGSAQNLKNEGSEN